MSDNIETNTPAHAARIMKSFAGPKTSATIGYYLAFITLGLIAAVIGPTLPSLAERTHTHLDEISILFTTRSLGYLLGTLAVGHAFDRWRGHPLIAAMLVTIAVLMALIPVIPVLWVLALVLFVLGISESAIDVGCNSLLIWLYREKVSPVMNGLHFCFGLGAFIAPIVIAQVVLATGDITWAYWLLALIILPGAFWLPRLPSPTLQVIPHEQRTGRASFVLVFLIALFMFLYVGAEGAFGAWVFTYATTLGLSDVTAAAYLTSAFWGALTVGRFVGIALAARFKPRTILFCDLMVCAASLGVIVLWSHSSVLLWLGAIGTGLGMASIYPAMLSLAERWMTITGQITGWISLGAGAGGMFLPWLIGQLFVRIGAPVTMLVILADVGVAMVVLVALAFGRKSFGTR